jgi:hypothetical protein|nr:MAG TPA: hypothetical protein [Caudoviricetes sp.]
MDSFIRLQLTTATIVRHNLVNLLEFIRTNHIRSIQKTEDGYLILKNDKNAWTKRATDFTFIGINDVLPDGVLSVEDFYQNRYEFLDKIFTTNDDISKVIYYLYDTLINLANIYQEPYNPKDTLFLYDHSSVYSLCGNGEQHFITHIENVPQYIPFDCICKDNDIIAIRTAVSQLYDLKCCIDPSIDYQLQQQLKTLQEEYPDEYNFNLKVQD